jgi:hypothetical protein
MGRAMSAPRAPRDPAEERCLAALAQERDRVGPERWAEMHGGAPPRGLIVVRACRELVGAQTVRGVVDAAQEQP